jgi:putative transcriptional regulator
VNIKDKEHVVINQVRELRLEAGLTQDELASSVNATRQTVVAIEKGNYVPSVLLALRLSEVLGRSVEEVFSYEKR